MVKQTVVHAYHEMLFINNKKELVIRNLDDFPRNYADPGDSKRLHCIYKSIHITFVK